MDLINTFMNLVFAPLAFIALLYFFPHYRSYKAYVSYAKAIIFREDVAGKIILITGASSGIGEHLAYEYAKRGACLALVARREHRLQQVAAVAEMIYGCPRAIYMVGDVSKAEDCKRFVSVTVDYFGKLDHLVCNAGIASLSLFEDFDNITDAIPVMDINFWGSVYSTSFALPHLKRSKGRIIVVSSAGAWLPAPRLSIYNASKAALISMYETLRVELGTTIGITIVTPGLTNTELTRGKFLSKKGEMIVDQEMADVQISLMPLQPASDCAKAIVDGACRGERYITSPSWTQTTFLWKVFCPEVLEWCNYLLLMTSPGTSQRQALSKKILDLVDSVREYVPIIMISNLFSFLKKVGFCFLACETLR